MGGVGSLFQRKLLTDLAQRNRQRSIRIERKVA